MVFVARVFSDVFRVRVFVVKYMVGAHVSTRLYPGQV
jgi:hypothetical protein